VLPPARRCDREGIPVEVVDTGGAVGMGVADRDDRSQWRQPAGMERRIVAASHAQRLALGRGARVDDL
jgi:hypothetical protein